MSMKSNTIFVDEIKNRPFVSIDQYKTNNGKFFSRIGETHLGTFNNFEDAVYAYNNAATKTYGSFYLKNMEV